MTELAISARPIAMSLHLDDINPIATCLVPGCRWHSRGGSMNDAVTTWAAHVARDHRKDWDD